MSTATGTVLGAFSIKRKAAPVNPETGASSTATQTSDNVGTCNFFTWKFAAGWVAAWVLGRILTGTAAHGSLIAWFLASAHGSQRVALSAGSHCVASSCGLSVWLSVLGSEIAS